MELGLYTFGELLSDPATGRPPNAQRRLKEIVDAAKLADEAGLDVIGLGEHHRLDMSISATPVVLAAIAQVTHNIRLTSAVTILSTADPVKVFEDFATVDLLSGGRAELIVGRGAFVESFPLFGYDLNDYNRLPRKARPAAQAQRIRARDVAGALSHAAQRRRHQPAPGAAAAAHLGGRGRHARERRARWPAGPAHDAGHHRRHGGEGLAAGHPLAQLKTGVSSHFHIAKDSQQAQDEFFPYYKNYFEPLARERGHHFQITHADYQRLASLEGGLFVGSPQQIIDKLLYQHELFGHQRYLGQLDIGGMPFAKVAEMIELWATQVAPAVRRATAATAAGHLGQS